MCIFVAIATPYGYILGSQRDDQKNRKTSLVTSFDATKKYQYVLDKQSGGTRFSHHTDGIYAVLLNKAPSINNISSLQTRGNLPLQCMDILSYNNDINQVMNNISSNLASYNSFILSVGKFIDNQLKHTILERDATQQQSLQYNRIWWLFLSASTLYISEIHEVWSQEALKLTDKNELLSFLVDRQYDIKSPYCIDKVWVVTKSRTIVVYQRLANSTLYEHTVL